MNAMVIDPSTKSLGWCWIKDGQIHRSGTIVAKGSLVQRLKQIYDAFRIFKDIDFSYVVTERMNYRTHHTVNMAIGVIFLAFVDNSCYVNDEISPNSWKSFHGLKQRDKGLKVRSVFKKRFPKWQAQSDDEIEAILMADYFLRRKK